MPNAVQKIMTDRNSNSLVLGARQGGFASAVHVMIDLW